eukprot:TRINITY_DN3670_c0_g1_i1.p1 TRINITY_DN3670_c0_g1~~TRINITY_DN3670_c0_g1_i1.p1  ORF type:complete len:217 (-),score=79.80 TRINITY_DN3670_c0_g1_i1:103-753(-)
MSQDEEFDTMKIVVIGDSAVGKTNISARFASNDEEFELGSKATIGVDIITADVTVSDQTLIKVQIWDTAGQDRFKAMTKGFYKDAIGGLIVYDVTKAQSFRNVEKWLSEFHEKSNIDEKELVMMLVGNKCDLKTFREVATEEAKKFAEQKGLLFVETSALNGKNIDEAFKQTIEALYQKRVSSMKNEENITKIPKGDVVSLDKKEVPSGRGCCSIL